MPSKNEFDPDGSLREHQQLMKLYIERIIEIFMPPATEKPENKIKTNIVKNIDRCWLLLATVADHLENLKVNRRARQQDEEGKKTQRAFNIHDNDPKKYEIQQAFKGRK